MRQKLLSITQKFVLPSICVLCNQFHRNGLAVCDFCTQQLIALPTACYCCANPVYDNPQIRCGECIKNPPAFDQTLVAYTFEEPLRSLLHRFKYNNHLYLAAFLCKLMLPAWQNTGSQCLIPVPLHPQKLKSRGFNQAAILAKMLAHNLKMPYELNQCQKIKNTEAQASLDEEQRRKNLRGAFSVNRLPYQHVTIVDDLLTTGSTVNELAKVLKKSGIKKIDVWCCARTIIRSN